MNPEKNMNMESASTKICPVTGLPVLRRPEWTSSVVGNGHRITAEVIGHNILHTKNFGYATLTDIENAVSLTDRVVNEAIAGGRPYVHILDHSNFKEVTLDGRKYFINSLKVRKPRPKGMIFYGASLLFKISINLARKPNMVPFDLHIVKNYSEAVKLALEILHASEIGQDVSPTINGMSTLITDPGRPTREIITRDDWSMETDHYSVYHEVIDGDILHSISTGVFEETLVEPLENLREKVITSGVMPDVSCYFVIGLGGIEKIDLKTRRLFIESLKNWYKKYPFRMVIFYGKSRMIRAAFNLIRPFLPFDARMVNTLEEVLELIAGEKTKRRETGPLPAGKDTVAKPAASEQIQQYFDELLRFMGGIDWNSKGLNRDRKSGPSHPLGTVFDAIELIKTDMDELLQERTEAEEKLRASEGRYHALFDNNPIETIIVDRKCIVTGYNLAKERSGGGLPDINKAVMYKDYACKHKINMFGELMECIASGISKEFSDQGYKDKFLDIRIAPFSEGAIITSINVTGRKQKEDVIRESRQRLADIIDFLPDATFAIDLEGKVVTWNRAIEEMTGVKAEDMLGRGNYEYAMPFYGARRPVLIDLISGPDKEIEEKYSFVHMEGNVLLTETELPCINEQHLVLWGKASPMYDNKGKVIGAIESIRDITDRKRAEEEIKRSLREKETLLAEIHHRVKNNMQIVSSLLSLQSKDIEDERALSLIKNCEDRIRSMSLVHEKLYLSKDLSSIDFHDYMEDLSARLFQIHRVDSRVVSFSSQIKDVSFNIETAIPLGLIINELISNALKHAFPEGKKGSIAVELTQDKKREEYILTVTDDGIGFPEVTDYRNTETFGLQLVDMLTEQFHGTMELDRTKGTSFRITFREQKYRKRI